MLKNILLPSKQLPIFIIGAGGIVNTAHLPAYKIAGFKVEGIFDIVQDKARATANAFGILQVFGSLEEMFSHAPSNAVFDVAVPGRAMISILQLLPDGCSVLLQKPMGENFEEAKEMGIIDEIPSAHDLLGRAHAIAQRLITVPRATFGITKRQLREPYLRDASHIAVASVDEIDAIWAAPETHEHIREYLAKTLKKK